MRILEDNDLAYEVIRSGRATTDIIIERDGRIVVRAPEWADDQLIANIVDAKHTGFSRDWLSGATSTPPACSGSTGTARGFCTLDAPTGCCW